MVVAVSQTVPSGAVYSHATTRMLAKPFLSLERGVEQEKRAGEAVIAAVAGEAELTLAQLKSMGTVGGATSG